jgi:adenosyl cobinamide kinase/adenosyl cobinamide phosphate guanylyltransferase
MVEKPKKALNVGNITNQKIVRIPFEGEFYEAYGKPQATGVWFVWGGSGSGKSAHAMQLAKEMSQRLKYKVLHNLCEEETTDSEYIERVEIMEMADINGYYFAQSYNYDQLCKCLDKPSTKIVIIDSATYFFKDKAQYMDFVKKYKGKKLIIITGHAEGTKPRSELEKDIMYNAKMKVFVSGYLASCKGRTIGPNGGTFIIWQSGYEKLRGTTQK